MQCGSKVEFGLQAPNFCPSCGSPFNESAKASTTAPAVEEESINEGGSVPRLSKLEYSIGDNARPVTFGDLAAQAQSSSQPYEKAPARPAPPAVEGEDILKATIAECSSARQPKELGD
jgi:hypothetical protein